MDISEPIVVLVGDQETRFVMYKAIAEQSSQIIVKALTGHFKEASTKTIRLPEITESNFGHYVEWLHDIELPCKSTSDKQPYDELMDLYVLGYFLMDWAFRNAVVNATLKTYHDTGFFPSVLNVKHVWDDTPKHCPMQTLLVELWATSVGMAETEDALDELPFNFTKRLVKQLVAMRGPCKAQQLLKWGDRHIYHEGKESE